MMNIAQQIAARSPIVADLTRGTFSHLSVKAGCAYLRAIVTPTVAGGLFALPAPEGEVAFETHRGWPIVWEAGYGFSAQRSHHASDCLGYCDSLDEIRAEIDEEIESRRRSYGSHYHEDTPSLDDSFHRGEMDVG